MKNTLPAQDAFSQRHIGLSAGEEKQMFHTIGISGYEELIDKTVPAAIRTDEALDIPEAMSEHSYLNHLSEVANKNKLFKTYIGQGYFGTITPSVILRNIFQNPGWYTQYTPYQAEIAQGRLEALLNYQTVVSDLCGLPIANASLLDEGTAAAEAMAMFFGYCNRRAKKDEDYKREFFVDENVYAQTLDVLKTRAEPLGIQLVSGSWKDYQASEQTFGVLLQYPSADGAVEEYRDFAERMKAEDIYITVATDLLALTLLQAPGEWGADAAVGNAQRFGVPMGYGGPHAAFFATQESFKRQIPGRIIGLSQDAHGDPALRMALQTREQHIRREKATSNICTAQALLAIMSGMYAVYHGPEGLRRIAERVHGLTSLLADQLTGMGYSLKSEAYFDTLCLLVDNDLKSRIIEKSEAAEINFFYTDEGVQISLDETVNKAALLAICSVLAEAKGTDWKEPRALNTYTNRIPENLLRGMDYLTHEVFHSYRTETEMMRYLKSLENKDLSLMHSMIALGSCTMKLNAATELIPVSWPEFANIHPFVPQDQVEGYNYIFETLEKYLSTITGFAACSLQPNSGAQGEYAGLLTIRAYHKARGDEHRNIALIPASAHGTNPASAVMAGMKVVVVKTDEDGNIDVSDLKELAEKHSENLAALMVTYPSTHGVFESNIKEICDIIHQHGGKVYMDGANMNAQVGITSPGAIHADVCHLNLHKTFAIPHGGGGPGMGPICVNESLAPFLPTHTYVQTGGSNGIEAVSSAPYGSASILLISYGYICMLGKDGLLKATEAAILNANYIRTRLEDAFSVLYKGENGFCAHELIIDTRPYKAIGVSVEDVAKRLIDYGFHAPTMSFPVPGTIMIEPTESESKDELDRFCDAMLNIKEEIDEIARGEADGNDNVLINAPHTLHHITTDKWPHTYSRQKAAYPLAYVAQRNKFWPAVGRVDNAFGDRNLICTCPPIEMYQDED